MLKQPAKAPETLSTESAKWWMDCVVQFSFKTAGELETLTQAALSIDRVSECRKVIQDEGLFTTGARGQVAHPATRLELQHRGIILQACRQLGISAPVQE